MRTLTFAAAAAVAVLAGACTPPAAKVETRADAPVLPACRDDGPRLADTEICAIDFGAYATVADGPEPTLELGCSWVINDALIGAGDLALLYRAASCKGVTTKLAWRNDAPNGDVFETETSAMYGDAAKGSEILRVIPAPAGEAGKAAVLEAARAAATDKAEAAACEVRPALASDWPKDAFVIDVSPSFAAKNAKYKEVYTACGPLGIDVDQATYWRLSQGHAWRFMLGQEAPDIDPRTVTLVRKGADGAWVAVE